MVFFWIFIFSIWIFTFGWVAKHTAIYAAQTGHNPWPWAAASMFFLFIPAILLVIVNAVEAKTGVK